MSCLRDEDEKDVAGRVGFWCGFFDAVGLFYFLFTLALWQNREPDSSGVGWFLSHAEWTGGLRHRRNPICREPSKLDFQGEEGLLWPNSWLVANHIVHLLRWCCSSAAGPQNLDTSLLPGDSACCSGKAPSGRRRLCRVLTFQPRHFSPSHKTSFLEILRVWNPSPQEQAVLWLEISIKQWAMQHAV